MPVRVVVIVGTRPEAIKLAPVILQLQQDERFAVFVLATGQHDGLALDALKHFDIEPDQDLSVLEPGQSLAQLSAKLLHRVTAVLQVVMPAFVVVQGDTTSATMGALAAFYEKIPVAHVEAGLRTYDASNPFPEEINRQLIARLASLHFAPTRMDAMRLKSEQIAREDVFVTGNTGIDALRLVSKGWQNTAGFNGVLVTCHRRENRDAPFDMLCLAVEAIAQHVPVLFVKHPSSVAPTFASQSVQIVDALDYPSFVRALYTCRFVITDSGGVQEEAPTFGKPVLVFRETTERQEAIAAGTAKLVGPVALVEEAHRLLFSQAAYEAMSAKHSPFGDGKAAPRIVSELARRFVR